MNRFLICLLILFSTNIFAQTNSTENLWRTRGVYDPQGNFMEGDKIQSFLFIGTSNQIYRLETQDRINMQTGEVRVVDYHDTLQIIQANKNIYKLNNEAQLVYHTSDSLTIKYKKYHLSYVKIEQPNNTVDYHKLQEILIGNRFLESINEEDKNSYAYQDNSIVIINDGNSKWESNYKLVYFQGYLFIQGIVSPPKLITRLTEDEIHFLSLDYRFDIEKGMFVKLDK